MTIQGWQSGQLHQTVNLAPFGLRGFKSLSLDNNIITFHRIPKANDFRANISQGSSGTKIIDHELKMKLFTMAEKVTKTLNIEIAGIDFMQSDNTGEIYFIESNSIPQWEGLTKITGINISAKIIDYFESL